MNQAKMKESTSLQLDAPRFENGKALVLAGLRSRYTSETMNGIRAQWERFVPYIGKVPGQVGHAAYGACRNFADGIDYLTGVEAPAPPAFPATSASSRFQHKNAPFSPTEDTFPNSVKHWMPSTSGSRDPALRLLAVPLKRQTLSSVIPRNSIRGPEWAAWKFGYQSNREGN